MKREERKQDKQKRRLEIGDKVKRGVKEWKRKERRAREQEKQRRG